MKFKVTVCVAYATVDDDDSAADGGTQHTPKQPKKKRVMEAPRAQNYFHFEYLLLPDEQEDPVR